MSSAPHLHLGRQYAGRAQRIPVFGYSLIYSRFWLYFKKQPKLAVFQKTAKIGCIRRNRQCWLCSLSAQGAMRHV
jgi:hypothetical protein